jgi:hypothetical protein
MITFNNTIKAILASEKAEAFMLFRILGDSDNVRPLYAETTFYDDITLTKNSFPQPGYEYRSGNTLLSADPPQATTNVDREQYKVSIADPDRALIENVEFLDLTESADHSGSQFPRLAIGRLMETRIGFVGVDGAPLLEIEDTVLVYKGRIDGAACTVDTNALGSQTLHLTGSSPMRNLDMRQAIFLSRDFMRKRNKTDTSCDQVYGGSGKMILKWGKI